MKPAAEIGIDKSVFRAPHGLRQRCIRDPLAALKAREALHLIDPHHIPLSGNYSTMSGRKQTLPTYLCDAPFKLRLCELDNAGVLELRREGKVERADEIAGLVTAILTDFGDRVLAIDIETARHVARLGAATYQRPVALPDLIIVSAGSLRSPALAYLILSQHAAKRAMVGAILSRLLRAVSFS